MNNKWHAIWEKDVQMKTFWVVGIKRKYFWN